MDVSGKRLLKDCTHLIPHLVFDPFVSEKAAKELDVELLSLEDVLATADFISLHMPLLPETQKFLNHERFAKMKPGIQVINCARGELIDEEAFTKRLKGNCSRRSSGCF